MGRPLEPRICGVFGGGFTGTVILCLKSFSTLMLGLPTGSDLISWFILLITFCTCSGFIVALGSAPYPADCASEVLIFLAVFLASLAASAIN